MGNNTVYFHRLEQKNAGMKSRECRTLYKHFLEALRRAVTIGRAGFRIFVDDSGRTGKIPETHRHRRFTSKKRFCRPHGRKRRAALRCHNNQAVHLFPQF